MIRTGSAILDIDKNRRQACMASELFWSWVVLTCCTCILSLYFPNETFKKKQTMNDDDADDLKAKHNHPDKQSEMKPISAWATIINLSPQRLRNLERLPSWWPRPLSFDM